MLLSLRFTNREERYRWRDRENDSYFDCVPIALLLLLLLCSSIGHCIATLCIFFFLSLPKKEKQTHIKPFAINESSDWLSFSLMIQLVFQSHGTINSLQYYEHTTRFFFVFLDSLLFHPPKRTLFFFYPFHFFCRLFSSLAQKGKSETVENCNGSSKNSRQP